jgi:hypothetical protein
MIELDAGPIEQPALGFPKAQRAWALRSHPVEGR